MLSDGAVAALRDMDHHIRLAIQFVGGLLVLPPLRDAVEQELGFPH